MKPKPAFATISALGNLFVLTFYPERRPDGLTSSSAREGYDLGVFRDAHGSGIPLVDYRTMDFTGYSCRTVIETCSHCFGGPTYIPLADWVAEVRRRGATVTHL